MKRVIVNVTIGVMAFWLGIICHKGLIKYLEVTSPTLSELNLAMPLPVKNFQRHLPPASLPKELQRIDEAYQKRCQLPSDWNGEWPTIIQLVKLRQCNDEWATARNDAINEELRNYLVQY